MTKEKAWDQAYVECSELKKLDSTLYQKWCTTHFAEYCADGPRRAEFEADLQAAREKRAGEALHRLAESMGLPPPDATWAFEEGAGVPYAQLEERVVAQRLAAGRCPRSLLEPQDCQCKQCNTPFDTLSDRMDDLDLGVHETTEVWSIGVPIAVTTALTRDTAPELERRLRLVREILSAPLEEVKK